MSTEECQLREAQMENGKIRVTKLAPGKFLGVADAAKALGVRTQTIYMVCGGYERALGPEKRARLVIVDKTLGGARGRRR